MTTIGTPLGYWPGHCPDKTAIVFVDHRVSFEQHHRRVLGCASALRSLGLRHGDSLVVMLRLSRISADELCIWINANVAARFQRVQQVVAHRDFPRNAAGKTLNRELRERHLQVSVPG